MRTYDEIRSLAKVLLDGGNVTTRRRAGERLVEQLSNLLVRRRLAEEVASSNQASKRQGLATVWRFVIMNAILATNKRPTSKKKAKLTEQDIRLPFKLLVSCNKSEQEYFEAAASWSQLQGSGFLLRTQTKMVVSYCLDMLEDPDVVEVAEMPMLEMLGFICARREYVAYFRPHLEMQVIMEEVEKRIGAPANDESVSATTRLHAAKVFEGLIRTANELEIGMQLLLPGCIKLLATWCTLHMGDVASSLAELSHLFGGLAVMLRSDPEQSVAPLNRHGRPILSFAMRCYHNASDHQRSAFHEYFSAHLLVAQTAGMLQGLMPGDLGDLGMATLKLRQINALLGLLLVDHEKHDSLPWPIGPAQRAQLELIARVMACAQRLHVSRATWRQMEDPTQVLIEAVEELAHQDELAEPETGKSVEEPLLVDAIAKSPFVNLVLRRLDQLIPGVVVAGANSVQEGEALRAHPLLGHLEQAGNGERAEAKALGPLLQVVSACAETFPNGSCWTTSTHGWHTLPPVEDDRNEDVVEINVGSPNDLAVIVDVVASLLERHGGQLGDQGTQKWILLCLLRLTEASAAQSYFSRDTPLEFNSLRTAWRRVWRAIFRGDLRYAAYTKWAVEGSSGELVLLLLNGMVRQFCVDPDMRWTESVPARQASFLFRRQVDLWNLPVFAGIENIEVPSSFDLIIAILFTVGLSNQGGDSIADALPSVDPGIVKGVHKTRRYRLVCLCLRALSESGGDHFVGAAVACCGALVHGTASAQSLTFAACDLDQSPDQLTICRVPQTRPTSFTTLEGFHGEATQADSVVECLWTPPLADIARRYHRNARQSDLDGVLATRTRLLLTLVSRGAAIEPADFVPKSHAALLFDLIRFLLPPPSEGGPVDVDDVLMEDGTSELAATEPVQTKVLPLSFRTASMKASIGARLACHADSVTLELQDMSGSISKLFKNIASELPSLCDEQDEFADVVSDLLQIIRALVQVSTKTRTDWSKPLLEGASSVYDACVSLLQDYVVGDAQEDVLPETQADAPVVDDEFRDDYDDDDHATGLLPDDEASDPGGSSRKRKHAGSQEAHNQPRSKARRSDTRSEQRKSCPNPQCAFLVASIVLALNPSAEACTLVANALLGIDKIGGNVDLDEEVDLLGAVNASFLLCTTSVLLHETALRKVLDDNRPARGSVVHLCCRLIEAIRFTSAPESGLHSYGFSLCVDIVRMSEDRYRDTSLTGVEAKDVVDILKGSQNNQQLRSLSFRPSLREEQLRAAVLAFRAGKDKFHGQMDRDFPRMFVLPSLTDLSSSVRRQASLAVAAAMNVLPQDRVVEVVTRRLPPVAKSEAERQNRKGYRHWYASRILGSGDGALTVEKQMWEDAFVSVEYGVINCLARIAGVSSSSTVRRQMLFDLVWLSFMREDLAATVFRAVEGLASLRATSIEYLMEYESEILVRKWLETGTSLLDLPLLVCSPRVFRRILRNGNYSTLTQDGVDNSNLDMGSIKTTAVSEFLGRHRGSIVPCILALSASQLLESSVTKDGRRKLLEDDYMKEICSVFEERYDDEVVKRLLKTCTPDIIAFCAPMHCGSESDQAIAEEVEILLRGIVSDDIVQRVSIRGAHLSIRRVLQLSGKDISTHGFNPKSIQCFSEATKMLMARLELPGSTGDGIFSRAGSSTTECMLYGKLWLEKGVLDGQLQPRWSSIQIVCDLVAEELCEDSTSDVQFCFHTLSDILLKPALGGVHCHALDALSLLLRSVAPLCSSSESIRGAVTRFASELLAACMHVHERCQQTVLENCAVAKRDRDRSLKLSLGVLGRHASATSNDAWGWDKNTGDAAFEDAATSLESALVEFRSLVVDRATLLSVTGTYGVIEYLIENSSSFGLHPDDFVGASPPYEVDRFQYDALYEVSPPLSAQRLVLTWLELHRSDESSVEGAESSLVPALLRRLRTKNDPDSAANSTRIDMESDGPLVTSGDTHSGAFSIEQRVLRAELVQLCQFLSQERSKSSDCVALLKETEVGLLVRELLGYCSVNYSEQVRLSASSCLGEIDLALPLLEFTADSSKDWIDGAISSKSLLRTLQARSIEVLVDCMKSPRVSVAMVSLETLKALLASREGAECQELLLNKTAVSALRRLLPKGRVQHGRELRLQSKEIVEIKATCNVTSTSEHWCWESRLWCSVHEEGSSFDQWICCLVPSLLVCCYGDTAGVHPGATSSNDFFSCCQRMSRLEPTFAVALFPAIILDLLENTSCPDGVATPPGVLADTWVGHGSDPSNTRISKSFAALLKGCVGSGSEGSGGHDRRGGTRPIDLVVDTLDLMRRLTQHRFLQSNGHQKNPAMPSELKAKNTGKSSKKSSQKEVAEHSDSSLVEPCRGLPFGVVLRMDGLLVVQACIRAKRFASALFYSELYADARFGRSTNVIESLDTFQEHGCAAASSVMTTGDISGFYSAIETQDATSLGTPPWESLQGDALSFMRLLRKCYIDLGEEEARRAVDELSSDLRFSGDSMSTGVAAIEGELSPSLYDLQSIDNIAGLERKSRASGLATVECLNKLGLRSTLQEYIRGLTADTSSVFCDDDTTTLREKWFENCLFDMQWDDTMLGPDGSSGLPTEGTVVATQRPSDEMWTDSDSTEGFHEWTANAMSAFTRDDTDLCGIRLLAARHQLLNRVSSLATGEVSLSNSLDVIDRLQVLNDLDGLVSKSESLEGVLEKWNLKATVIADSSWRVSLIETTRGQVSSSLGFSECLREITLRSIVAQEQRRGLNEVGPEVLQHLATHIWRICSANCDSGRYNVAEAALQRLYRLVRFSGVTPDETAGTLTLCRLKLQEAVLMERKGNFTGAIRLVKQTIKRIPDERGSAERDSLMADSLVTAGRWMTKHKVEPAGTILDSYLKRGSSIALAAYEKETTTATACCATEAFLAIGQVASNLYETVAARVKSPEWQKANTRIEDRAKELTECDKLIKEAQQRYDSAKKRKKKSKEISEAHRELREAEIYRLELTREITNANTESEKIQSSVSSYHCLALRSFVSALSIADSSDPAYMSKHVYRMISLWFSRDTKAGTEVDSILKEAVDRIPSFRFVPLASQLFSRLGFDEPGEENEVFQERLQRLIFKMCRDHPYHCLIHLITLSNGKRVGSGRHASAFLENTSATKVNKAKDILKALKKEDLQFVCQLIESMETLADAYIHLAMTSTDNIPRTKKIIPLSQVCSSKNQPRLDKCLGTGARRVACAPCVLTKPPTLRPGCDYGDGMVDPLGTERVVGFESCFSITDGGLHRPKIVVCLGSKGGRFRQLVKGEDEVRQDAVMEQVFGYVNELMARQTIGQGGNATSGNSERNPLRLVTYNIVPLSPASGVLEWVENTIPFGDYLIDRGARRSAQQIGAHSKYCPGEWGSSMCRDYLKELSPGEKRKAYDTVCDHHSPVFRYFFVERFGHSLEAWHAAKMRYTRSVAVNSVVGHVLGIGDRHCSNILVHEKTGEVVHIDFGIVFEQGKLLNTPENIPFRLSRNIVDGMGPTGIEGTFTKAAEETMTVLKHNSNALLTILSGIVSDPLYKWSISPVKARQRQQLSEKEGEEEEEEEGVRPKGRRKSSVDVEAEKENEAAEEAKTKKAADTNEAAAHAITRIQEKLQGYEDGTSGEQQSVEGQVQLLINSATDPNNLCSMFVGWAPWM